MTTFGGNTVLPIFSGSESGGGGSPFINSGTLIAPNIVNIPAGGPTWSWRQWGRLSDSLPLGLFNGYINFTDTGAPVFPWTQTLNVNLIHFDPRLDYDEDDYWYRVQSVQAQAPAPTQSYNLIVPGVYTPTQSWTIGHTAPVALGGWRTMRLDWSTDNGATTFAEIFIRFVTVP